MHIPDLAPVLVLYLVQGLAQPTEEDTLVTLASQSRSYPAGEALEGTTSLRLSLVVGG